MDESTLSVFIAPSQFETCFLPVTHIEDDLKKTVNAFDGALHAVATTRRSV